MKKILVAALAVGLLAACGSPAATGTTVAPTVTVTAPAPEPVEESTPALPDTGLTEAEAATEASEHFDAYSAAIQSASEEMGSDAPDTDLIRDYLATMKDETAALEDLQDDVPPCAGEALTVAVKAMKKINKGVGLAADSYDSLDIDGLSRALDLVNSGSTGVQEATDILGSCL